MLEKCDPEVVLQAGPRERQIVQHEQIDSSDDTDSSEDLGNVTPDSTNDAISEIDDTFYDLHV